MTQLHTSVLQCDNIKISYLNLVSVQRCAAWRLSVKEYHPSQLTELKSAKPEGESLGALLDAEDGAKGSLPLNGSPRPFLLWNGSMASPPNGWKGSHGLEGSAVPDMLTGVLLPEDIKDRGNHHSKKHFPLTLSILLGWWYNY